jgi:Protein of unknown function (DUF4199)
MFNKSFLKTVLLYGVIAGLLTLLYCWIIQQTGQIPLDGKKAPSLMLSLICMVLAVKAYRKSNPDETLHFWEGFVVANITNLVGACVSALGLYVWLSSDGNTILSDYISQTISMLQVPNVKLEYVKEMGIESFNSIISGFKVLSPKNIATDEIIGLKGKIPLGILTSVMISLYYRRQYLN